MHALTGRDDATGFSLRHAGVECSHLIDPDAGCIDHTAGVQRVALTRDGVDALNTTHPAGFNQQAIDGHPIEQQRALLGSGSGDGQSEAGIIELTVPELHAAPETVGSQGGQRLECLHARQP